MPHPMTTPVPCHPCGVADFWQPVEAPLGICLREVVPIARVRRGIGAAARCDVILGTDPELTRDVWISNQGLLADLVVSPPDTWLAAWLHRQSENPKAPWSLAPVSPIEWPELYTATARLQRLENAGVYLTPGPLHAHAA